MKALSILVVEDNPDVQETIREYLTPEFDVIIAKDGAQGLSLATSLRPSLILTDLVVPQLDGIALCRALRAEEATRQIPIIVMSGHGTDETKHAAISAGADDFLPKPFRQRELLARIGNQLGPSWI